MHPLLGSLLLWTTAFTVSNCHESTAPIMNSNHIFNALHDSMRQFGNSLNHNGMSIFLAAVPQDTEFYHGTPSPYRINGTEWLAFEPEHALIFARPPQERPGGKPPEDRPSQITFHQWHTQPEQDYQPPDYSDGPKLPTKQERLVLEGHAASPESHGYLHAYRTKHDLRLLYLDGQSAAKSQKGTLDIQDYVLLPEYLASDKTASFPRDEVKRAIGLCELAHSEWQGRIDGVLMMEGGFEIVLCDFEKDLELVQILQARSEGRWDRESEEFNYYRAVAARYEGIGGRRVRLDTEDFITLYAYPDAIFFDDNGRPRVYNGSELVSNVCDAITNMALREHKHETTDWQAVTDMVVARYSDRIEYLASGDWSDLTSFQDEVEMALLPFIDYGARSFTDEIEQCSHQFLPTRANRSSLSFKTILNVTTTICSELSSLIRETDLSIALTRIRALKTWLAWTDWKKCRGCGYHEICFLPIWPVGSEEDFEQPKCRSNIRAAPGGYRRGFGPH